MSNAVGQASAATLYMGIRSRSGRRFYGLLFWTARRVRYITAPLQRNEIIHFARWTLVDRLPQREGWRRLDPPMLWFESNYDGNLSRYMDTFARALTWRMRAAWGPAEGFPGLFPQRALYDWTVSKALDVTHYWSAYPDATTRDVGRALRVRRDVADLAERATTMSDEDFAHAYRAFLRTAQVDL